MRDDIREVDAACAELRQVEVGIFRLQDDTKKILGHRFSQIVTDFTFLRERNTANI